MLNPPIQPITKKKPRKPVATEKLQTLTEGPDKKAATEQNGHDIQGHTGPRKIGIFISYNHEDRVLATVLRQCLITLSEDLVPFIDHIGLEAGDTYENELEKSIGASQWFIMLCSGPLREKDMSWCLYEAGQFRRKFLQEGVEQQIKSHLFAIYDHEIPRPLAQLQGVSISRRDIFGHNLDLKTDKKAEELEEEALVLFENTPIFDCFRTIISKSRDRPLRDLADTGVRRILKTNSRTLISAFVNHTIDRKVDEIVFQPRISFWLPPPADQSSEPSRLKADTPVTADGDVLRELFGLIGKRTTWGTIKARCSQDDGNEPAWVNGVEAAADEVSRDQQPKQPAGLHYVKSDQKFYFYRVIFARCDLYTSGSRLCYILFIPRSCRDFDVKEKTSRLLSSLILSIRFRQRVLPLTERLQTLSRKDKFEGVLEIEKKLLEIETEALEFGLQTPDDDPEEFPILEVFREGENKSFVEQAILSWQPIRRALAGVFKSVKSADDRNQIAVEGAEVIVKELKNYQQVNGRFISVLTEELLFLERVAAGE